MSNVGYATVSIIPSAKGFGAALNKEIGPSVTSASRGFGDKAGKGFKGAFMAPLAALGPAVAASMGAAAVGGFLKDAVGQASDLAEVGTALKTVFGDGLAEVEKFGGTGAKALGMSKLEALNAAQTFGVYGKAAGLTGKENAKFSTGLAALGTDLASFYNSSPEEAIAAIGSGLRGEAEPLRKFGVLLDDATLRAQAMKMGLIDSTKEALTPQNKVLAAQAAIMDQSKVAQGDFAKTSGGLANQQRILAAQWTDAKGKIGGVLLPVVLSAVKGFNGLFDALAPIGDGLSGVFSILGKGDFKGSKMTFGLAEDSPVVEILFKIREAFLDVLPVVKNLATQAGPMLSRLGTVIGSTVVPLVKSLATTFTTLILPAAMRLGGYIVTNVVPIFQRLAQMFLTQVLPIIRTFATFIVTNLVPAVVRIVVAVGQRLKPVFDAVYGVIRDNVLPAVQNLLTKFREWQPTIMKVTSAVVGIVGWVLKLAAAILGKVLPPIIKFAGFLLGKVIGAVVAVVGWVIKFIGWIVDLGLAFPAAIKHVNSFVAGLREKFLDAVAWVKSVPGKIVDALGNLKKTLLGAGGKIIDGFLEGIQNGFKRVKDKLGELTDLLPDWKGPVALDKVILKKNGEHVINGFVKGLESRYGAVRKSLGSLTNSLAVGTPAFGFGSAAAASASAAGAPLVGHLSIESRGDAKSDLEEALFQLRRLNRGGR